MTRSGRATKQRTPFWLRPATALVTETIEGDPISYRGAMRRADAHLWQKAIDEELASLVKNDIYDVVRSGCTPAGTKAIACKWVFKRKPLPDGFF